jgi:hypothetical protein
MKGSQARAGLGFGLLAASLLGWTASPARADEVDVADVDRRYAFVDAELERSRGPAQAWWTVWTASYSAATLGGAGVAVLATGHPLRISAGVLAAKSVLGVGSLALTWRPLWGGATADLHAMDATTPEARAARLARAEVLLERRARAESIAHGWITQVASIGVNLAGSAVLWFGYHQQRSALVEAGTGLAICEVQILTTPQGAVDALRRYRAGDLTPRAERQVSWAIIPWPGGGALHVSF